MGGAPRGGGPVIAIDGPAGSGKSTVAREVARRLGLRYLDTGAMYRALTWQVIERAVPLAAADLSAAAEAIALQVETDPERPRISVAGRDVTTEVREPGVTALVSQVSAVPGVRTALVRRQREIIGAGGIVVEGRDIGSVVAPQASPKVFLTAPTGVRARRRTAQGVEGAGGLSVVRGDIERRDRSDSTRGASPLMRAEDAVQIDTGGLTVAEVVAEVLDLVGPGAKR